MGLSKQRHCKCGHNQDSHKNSYFSFSSACHGCACTSYLNRDQPDKISYLYLVLSIGIALFLITLTLVLMIETDPALQDAEEKIIKFTYANIYNILKLLGFIMIVFVVGYMIIGPITNLLYIKNRRKYPISD